MHLKSGLRPTVQGFVTTTDNIFTRLPRTVQYPGQSPTLEELQRILRIADPHEKLIVLLLATGGFREGTLSQLKYGNIRNLYLKAGIIKHCSNRQEHKRKGPDCTECGYPNITERRHKLCVHSLRWFFRTHLTSNEVNPEYVEFMMGDKTKLYNDARIKGPEFLRLEYSKADLSTIPKPKLTDRQVIEALLRGRGLDPVKILREDAFNPDGYSEPHRVFVSPEEKDDRERRRLVDVFVKSVFDDNDILLPSSARNGSPGETREPSRFHTVNIEIPID